jgi:hypothetical protein
MRFAVETWAPEYGSPNGGEVGLVESEVAVDLAVERDPGAWAPVTPPSATEVPPVILFVDGVRRVEARVWVTSPGGEVHPGICASYAAGVVRCDGRAPRSSRVVTIEVGRGLFCRSAGAADIATRHGPFTLRATAVDDPDALSLALQGAMGELERSVSAGAATPGELLVVDGPLGARRALPGTVGYVKTHHVSYLPPELVGVVGALAAGQRTPVFCMGERFPRHSWYLRLPGEITHAWAGVVRCEAATDVEAGGAVALADQIAAALPRFASTAHKDPRAPQNLFPIAGLERQLRHRLGDPLVIQRALREAAQRSGGEEVAPG